MVKNYPLYEELCKIIAKKKAENKNKRSTNLNIKSNTTTISDLDNHMSKKCSNEHYEEITAIILHYNLVKEQNFIDLPKAVKKVSKDGKGLRCTLTSFDYYLQELIDAYIEYYSKEENCN